MDDLIFDINLNNSEYRLPYKGFGSIFAHVINSIGLAQNLGFSKWNISIDKFNVFFDSLYYKNGIKVDGGDYFISVHKEIQAPIFSAHVPLNFNTFLKMTDIASQNFELKSSLNDFAMKKFELLQKNNCFCAVHIRGTDKITEINLPNEDEILNTILLLLSKSKSDYCFVETDDINFASMLKNKNLPLIFDLDEISYLPKHFSSNNNLKRDIIHSRLLSMFEYFGYSFSNFSYMSLCLSRNKDMNFIPIYSDPYR